MTDAAMGLLGAFTGLSGIDLRAAVAGAVGGFLSAVVVDVNAWSKSDRPFDWGLAVKRWVAGAVSGFVGGLGAGAMGGGA